MRKLLAALVLAMPATLAQADAVTELMAALDQFKQLQGKFEQQQFPQGDGPAVTSSGEFRLLRPGYFSWEIQEPDSQLIVANPKYIWHYDRDLETVTRRPTDTSAGMTPLQVLGGDETALREAYSVTRELTPEQGYVLRPRHDSAGFKQLAIQMHDNQISGMEILDNLGQRVEISFSGMDQSSALTSKDFDFSPPADADLFYYDE